MGILTAGWGSWREEIEEIESLMVALQGFGSGNERPALSAHDCKDSDLYFASVPKSWHNSSEVKLQCSRI